MTKNPPLYSSRHSRNEASDPKCDTFSNGPFPNGQNGHRLKEICCLGGFLPEFSEPPPSPKWAGIAQGLPGWPLGLCSLSRRRKSQLNSDFGGISIAPTSKIELSSKRELNFHEFNGLDKLSIFIAFGPENGSQILSLASFWRPFGILRSPWGGHFAPKVSQG